MKLCYHENFVGECPMCEREAFRAEVVELRAELERVTKELSGDHDKVVAQLQESGERVSDLLYLAGRVVATRDGVMETARRRGQERDTLRAQLDEARRLAMESDEELDEAHTEIIEWQVKIDEARATIEKLEASLPFHSGRDENKAVEALGDVMRHTTDPENNASIGVVEVNRAKSALVFAYGESNALNETIAARDETIEKLEAMVPHDRRCAVKHGIYMHRPDRKDIECSCTRPARIAAAREGGE